MANNQAAALLMPPVNKEKVVSPPLPVVPPVPAPVVHDKVVVKKQMAVLVQVDMKPPASSLLSISPAPKLAVMPADHNNRQRTTPATTPPAAVPILILLMVCIWAIVNAVVFAVADVATLLVNRTPCTKSTWLIRCVELTDAAAKEMGLLLYGELLCSAAAALAAPLYMWLTTRTLMRSRFGAAVDALAWVALAATGGLHCMEVVSDRIVLAAKPADNYVFADVVYGSVCFAVDLLAGVLLCCSPRRRLELGEQQGHDDGEAAV